MLFRSPQEEKKEQSEKSEIVLLPSNLNAMTIFSTENGLDPIIKEIKARVESEIFDVTTERGRERIGSVARQIGSAKKRLEEMALGLTEDWRKQTAKVNEEKRRMVSEMDELRDKVLAPRREFEAREAARVQGHRDAMADIDIWNRDGMEGDPSSEEIKQRIAYVESIERDWQEFSDTAAGLKARVIADLKNRYDVRKKYEDDQAELERLRREQAERERKEHEEKIAREAAEIARKEAEEKAERERAEAEAKAKAEQERLEREKAEAEAKAKAEQERLEREKAEAEAKAKAAEEREKQAAIEAEAAAKQREEAAAKAEREKIEAEERLKQEEEKKRAADTENRRRINSEALSVIHGIIDELSSQGKDGEEIAKTIVTWIASGKIPHVSIKY